MRNRYFILLVVQFIGCGMVGQLDRYGSPVSWTVGSEIEENSAWNVLAVPDLEQLLAEDNIESADRAVPYRFAYAHTVEMNTGNSGRWTNLRNGDRLWMLGVECPGAISIALTLSHVSIPKGARLYVYSADRSDFIGPLKNQDMASREMLGLPHLKGSRIVLEYYEPYASRGLSFIEVSKVAHAYRDLRTGVDTTSDNCIHLNSIRSGGSNLTNASASVMMMLVDYGQRAATATMLNNSSVDATPYVITSESALIGPPASWCFQYNLISDFCDGFQSGCGLNTICGADIIKADKGIALLRLNDSPSNNWSAYFSGWRINPDRDSSSFVSIQHARGRVQSKVLYTGKLEVSSYGMLPTMALSDTELGQSDIGSAGSPVFDNEMNLVGIYIGGDLDCAGNGFDHFAMLSESWTALRNYLDPFDIVEDRIEGYYPRIIENNVSPDELNIFFFPNPSNGWIYVQNESDLPLSEILIHNASGNLVDRFRPLAPTISVDQLPEGLYLITFVAGNERRTQKLLIR